MKNPIDKSPKFLLYFSLTVFLTTCLGFSMLLFYYHPRIIRAHESTIYDRSTINNNQRFKVLKTKLNLHLNDHQTNNIELKVKYYVLGIPHFSTIRLATTSIKKTGNKYQEFHYKILSSKLGTQKLPINCVIYSKEISSNNLLKSIIKI